jgi:hypothetical protein
MLFWDKAAHSKVAKRSAGFSHVTGHEFTRAAHSVSASRLLDWRHARFAAGR